MQSKDQRFKLTEARIAWARRVYDRNSENLNYRHVTKLARLCGVSRQYMHRVLNGEVRA